MGATESTPAEPRASTARTRERNAARNEAIATLFDSDAPSVVVPTNCAIRIFSMLDREDLESARLVCRVWNHVIDYVGRPQMQTRPIDVLELSSHRDTSSTSRRRLAARRGAGANRPLVIPPYKYPCHHRFRGHLPHIDPLFRFVSDHRESVYEKVCAGRTPHEIYRQRNAYSSKLFTPPLAFYERLEWLVRDATVKHLVFINFTFTDLFVEKLEEFLGLGFPVERVFVHNCSLKYLSVAKWHHLVGRVLSAQQFFFEHVRNTLPAHFGNGLFETPAFLSATTIMIDGVFSRHGRMFVEPLRLNFRIEDLLAFVQRRREQGANQSDFLGVSHVRQSEEEIIREYAVEFRRADGAPHFFRHVVFGQRSFVGNALADVQRME
ncbi:hypothetical protein M3Y99_01251700 [Aphelenchoides fujianensis]|nr:hypothetical protein M3Y99_01251700 [Aphelenchoides fujianensis]